MKTRHACSKKCSLFASQTLGRDMILLEIALTKGGRNKKLLMLDWWGVQQVALKKCHYVNGIQKKFTKKANLLQDILHPSTRNYREWPWLLVMGRCISLFFLTLFLHGESFSPRKVSKKNKKYVAKCLCKGGGGRNKIHSKNAGF